MSENRSSFSGKVGFILAAAGSAVGLGNIWRFPYLAAMHGGGIFLLVYIILSVTLGFTLLCAEIAIGRKTGMSAIGAFKQLNKKYSFIGWMASIVPMIILPYYSVIGGWVTKYIAVYATGKGAEAAGDAFFGSFISKAAEPIVWFLIFMGITAIIVLFGVEKGIEKVSKFMMPLLVVLTVFIAVYVMFMDGALKGVAFYFKPDFSKFSVVTVLAALGQLFYSMSLAMGIMITYGSYMKKDINIESSVKSIELFDTGIAFLAGLMVVPAVFSFYGGDEAVLNENLQAGASLMFKILPKVFNDIPGGAFVGVVFFILVLFAALTSSISLMETIVSILQDKLGWSRKFTCLIVFAGCVAIGVPTSLGYGLLDMIHIGGFYILEMLDFVSNSVIMPVVALLTCLFIGYVIKPKCICDEIENGGKFKKKVMFNVMIKYIAPVCIVLILVFSIVDAIFGVA